MVAALSVRLTLSHIRTAISSFHSPKLIQYIHTYIHVISGIKVINAQKLGAKAVMIGEQRKHPVHLLTYLHTYIHTYIHT